MASNGLESAKNAASEKMSEYTKVSNELNNILKEKKELNAELDALSKDIAFKPEDVEGLGALRAQAAAVIVDGLGAYSDFYAEAQINMQVLENSDISLEKNLEFWEVDDNDSAGENYGGSDLSDYIDSDGDDEGIDIDDHEDSQKNTPSFADTERKSGGVKDDLAAEPEIQEQKVNNSEVKVPEEMQSGDIDTESKSGGAKGDLAAEPEIEEQKVNNSEVKVPEKEMQSGDIDTESKSGGVKGDLAAEPEIKEQKVKNSEVKVPEGNAIR